MWTEMYLGLHIPLISIEMIKMLFSTLLQSAAMTMAFVNGSSVRRGFIHRNNFSEKKVVETQSKPCSWESLADTEHIAIALSLSPCRSIVHDI